MSEVRDVRLVLVLEGSESESKTEWEPLLESLEETECCDWPRLCLGLPSCSVTTVMIGRLLLVGLRKKSP